MSKEQVSMNYINKITAKDCGLTPKVLKPLIEKTTESIPVATVMGRIFGSKPGNTQMGEYTQFDGEFQLNSEISSQKFRADKLIMPGISESLLVQHVNSAKEPVSKDAPIEFAVQLTVSQHVYGDEVKHKWGVKPLIEPKGSTALDDLEQKLLAKK